MPEKQPASLTIWWLAIRPKTLSISVTPVLLGSALSWQMHQAFSFLTFAVILLSALFIQIGTNLYNDVSDFERGADTSDRMGPRRAAQQGWLNAKQIKSGAFVSFLLAFCSGIYLAIIGGLPIIILGLISIVCGYAYTAGPKPIAYSPLGEVFVLIFFGLAAVGGTFYLQSMSLNSKVLIHASSLGTIAAAILLINNYRDLDSDRQAHKLTLVHYINRPAARILYAVMILYPYITLLLFYTQLSWLILIPFISILLAIWLIYCIYSWPVSSRLNQLLARTAQLQLIYTLLLSLILVIHDGSSS